VDCRFPRPPVGNTSRIRRFAAVYYSGLEQLIFSQADVLTSVTALVADSWRKRYPRWASKIQVMWNGFDSEETVAAAAIPARPYKSIAHVGSMYAGRSPHRLLAAVERIIQAGRLNPNTVRLLLSGPVKTRRGRPLVRSWPWAVSSATTRQFPARMRTASWLSPIIFSSWKRPTTPRPFQGSSSNMSPLAGPLWRLPPRSHPLSESFRAAGSDTLACIPERRNPPQMPRYSNSWNPRLIPLLQAPGFETISTALTRRCSSPHCSVGSENISLCRVHPQIARSWCKQPVRAMFDIVAGGAWSLDAGNTR